MMTSDFFPLSPSPSEVCSRSLESPSLIPSGAVSKSDSGDDVLVPFRAGLVPFTLLIPPLPLLGTACLTFLGLGLRLLLLPDLDGDILLLAGTFFSPDAGVVSPPPPCFFASWRLSKMDEADLDDEELAAIEEGEAEEEGGGGVPSGFLAPARVERSARSVVMRGESRPLIGSFDDFAVVSSSNRIGGGGGGALGWEEGVKKLSCVSMGRGREG